MIEHGEILLVKFMPYISVQCFAMIHNKIFRKREVCGVLNSMCGCLLADISSTQLYNIFSGRKEWSLFSIYIHCLPCQCHWWCIFLLGSSLIRLLFIAWLLKLLRLRNIATDSTLKGGNSPSFQIGVFRGKILEMELNTE